MANQIAPLPDSFAKRVLAGRERRIKAQSGTEGLRAGNQWLVAQVSRLDRFALDLSASDDDIRAFAVECIDDVRSFLSALVVSDRSAVLRQLDDYAYRRAGFRWPSGAPLAAVTARMTDAGWWRRMLRKHIGRGVDQSARELGMVHRRAGLYCADETVRWHADQTRRNRMMLEGQEAVNQFGDTFGLDELADKGLAKAANRRADLMVRIRGFEDYAREHGHVGIFITWTAPSAYHPRTADGRANPRYIDGSTPRDAHALISRQWDKARAKLGHMGIHRYGFRVVEPHHDGTPHWHMLVFVAPENLDALVSVLAKYARAPEPQEMTTPAARRARFDFKLIDWKRGSAAGYIAKYIAKNIDGCGEAGPVGDDFEASGAQSTADTSARVRAWASRWGIRQFQQIGGPSVTGYRELRRLRHLTADGIPTDFHQVLQAANDGQWHHYVTGCGGIDTPRAERPLQLARHDAGRLNRYGEAAAPELIGVEWKGALVETRLYQWEIRKKAPQEAGKAGAARAPWTRVNNCTRTKSVHSRFSVIDGKSGGDPVFPPSLTTPHQHARASVHAHRH
ncbi:replication endonuclease [Denitromonas sp. IR12]|uniref:Replication endonuclease n=1 Tax=Denitromonas iodatirespirans TaxID=2795389 RepID=A0A944D8T2_DENI1|nr:replication endonuclease [Denitromonas iodatirespirans]